MSIITKPYFTARKNNGVLYEPDANCELWWPGQDDPQTLVTTDRSGNGRNGTVTGALWKQTGQGTWYLDFDGTDDKIAVTYKLDDNTDWAVEQWVFVPSSGIDAKGLWGYDGSYTLYNTGGVFRLYWGAALSTADVTPTVGAWNHLIVGRDANSWTQVLNGVTSSAHTSANTKDSTAFIFGGQGSSSYGNQNQALWRFHKTTPAIVNSYGNYHNERHLFGV